MELLDVTQWRVKGILEAFKLDLNAARINHPRRGADDARVGPGESGSLHEDFAVAYPERQADNRIAPAGEARGRMLQCDMAAPFTHEVGARFGNLQHVLGRSRSGSLGALAGERAWNGRRIAATALTMDLLRPCGARCHRSEQSQKHQHPPAQGCAAGGFSRFHPNIGIRAFLKAVFLYDRHVESETGRPDCGPVTSPSISRRNRYGNGIQDDQSTKRGGENQAPS